MNYLQIVVYNMRTASLKEVEKYIGAKELKHVLNETKRLAKLHFEKPFHEYEMKIFDDIYIGGLEMLVHINFDNLYNDSEENRIMVYDILKCCNGVLKRCDKDAFDCFN